MKLSDDEVIKCDSCSDLYRGSVEHKPPQCQKKNRKPPVEIECLLKTVVASPYDDGWLNNMEG